MNISPLDKKFESFGWNVIICEDGNDFDEIDKAFKEAEKCTDKPNVIIAKTVKGKGVSFMENEAMWHGTAPNEEQKNKAIEEILA